MSALLKELPPGDPRKGFWTYDDLAEVFALANARAVRKRMPQWEQAGFPAHLPYDRREHRWKPEAVLRWKNRFEIRHGADAPQLVRA